MHPRSRSRKLRATAAVCSVVTLAGAPVALARPAQQHPVAPAQPTVVHAADAGGAATTDVGTWLATGGLAAALLASGALVRSAGRQGRGPAPRPQAGL